ncbi:hypothetical protein N665_0182s0016 [Sinapis alba]|nr:hypothetical protein N665_0182s0016 [Sinapis alba]
MREESESLAEELQGMKLIKDEKEAVNSGIVNGLGGDTFSTTSESPLSPLVALMIGAQVS